MFGLFSERFVFLSRTFLFFYEWLMWEKYGNIKRSRFTLPSCNGLHLATEFLQCYETLTPQANTILGRVTLSDVPPLYFAFCWRWVSGHTLETIEPQCTYTHFQKELEGRIEEGVNFS